jgi:hypothetical protein
MKKFFQLICSFFVALAFNACVEDFKIGDKFMQTNYEFTWWKYLGE